jgi:hypothetical protein
VSLIAVSSSGIALMTFSKVCIKLMITVLPFILDTTSSSQGAEVGLQFSAQVTFASENNLTYGHYIPTGSVLTGHLVYESNTPIYEIAPTGCTDCAAYRHRHINGLHVEFPGLTLQADEYIVQVRNDHNVSGVGIADILTVWFPDQNHGPSPDLGRPLLINGNPVSAGLIRIDFVAVSTTFPNSSLPVFIDPAAFTPTAGSGNFGDGQPLAGFGDVFFKPQSVSAFPHSTSDHNLDGKVDGRDFLIWQRNVGMNWSDGDADSNLVIDGVDLEMWQAEYASPLELFKGGIIPEPATLALLVATSPVLIVRPKTRRFALPGDQFPC